MTHRAMIYRRVSTDEQAEHGHSLAAQEQLCRERAAADGLPVEADYCDDGYSGATLERPAMQQLLREMQRGDVIYCYRLDRLSRSVEDVAMLMRLCQQCGATVRPLVGAADLGNSLGRAFVGIQAVFGQLERETLAERVAMGMRRRIESGRPFPCRPYGYRREAGVQAWEIVPAEAEIVRDIARLRLGGLGYHSICRRLDERGLPPPRGQRFWHSNTIAQILRNPAYVGRLTYKGRHVPDVAIPAILDEAIWARLQALNNARRRHRTWEGTDYLLSGLVWCGRCGCRMGPYRHQNRRPDGTVDRYASYRCTAGANRPSASCRSTVSAAKLARLVLEELDALADGAGASPLIALPPPRPLDVSARLAALDRELEALEVHLLGGRIAPERFDAHRARILEARQEALALARRHEEAGAYQAYLRDRLQALAGGLVAKFEASGTTPALKARVLQLVERIDVGPPTGEGGKRPGLAARQVAITLRAPEA